MKRIKESLVAHEILSYVFRLILGAVFTCAGVMKVADPKGFAQAVYNYQILPGWLVNPVAIVLPWIEIVAGVSLILGILIPAGALVVSVLLFVFTCALGFNLARGLDISCGCFSSSSTTDPISWMYIIRDLALLSMGSFVFFFDKARISVDHLIGKIALSSRGGNP